MAQQKFTFFILIITLMLIYKFQDATGCFITNCPNAGKRSIFNQMGPNHLPKECIRCGPALSGRCYGPNICCSPLIGCNIGGFAAVRCALEAYNPNLCSNPGSSCGPNGKGVCALNSTCCTNDGCFMDKSCNQNFIDTLVDLNL